MNYCKICGHYHNPDCITIERAMDESRELTEIELNQQNDYWYECQRENTK